MIQFLRDFFFRDWLLKFFSLALAVLIWLAVSFSLRQRVLPVVGTVNLAEKTYSDLPVIIVSRNADVSRFKAEPAEVDVTFRGGATALEQLPRTSIRIFVDLTDTVLKVPQELPVEIVAPAGVAHIRIKPDNLVRVIPPTPPEKSE